MLQTVTEKLLPEIQEGKIALKTSIVKIFTLKSYNFKTKAAEEIIFSYKNGGRVPYTAIYLVDEYAGVNKELRLSQNGSISFFPAALQLFENKMD